MTDVRLNPLAQSIIVAVRMSHIKETISGQGKGKMNKWLLDNLVCPNDKGPLQLENNVLTCGLGHRYAVVDDIPVMLRPDVEQTLWVAQASLDQATQCLNGQKPTDEYYVKTLGVSEEERQAIERTITEGKDVDAVVQYIVGATSGYLYKSLIGNLTDYPIPELRLPEGKGQMFLDIGCNWGRWCVAATRKNYRPIGIDPSLGAVMAARRVSHQMGLDASFVVADARHLPFASESFSYIFSYSVLQHLSKEDVRLTLKEVARTLQVSGTSLIQMPNQYGIRCLVHQAKRRFRDAQGFEVRYWSPSELRQTFAKIVGPTVLSVDGYFGLGIQASDVHLLPPQYKLIVHASELLRKLSIRVPGMKKLADSLYVSSRRKAA